MIAGGTDVATVAGILDHSQPSTTLDIYTHAFNKNKKAASEGTARDAGGMNMISTLENNSSFVCRVVVCVVVTKKEVPRCTTT